MFRFKFIFVLASNILLGKNFICNGLAEKIYFDLELSENLFQNYINDFHKSYTSEEIEYRFEVFKENLKRINELNKKHESTIFGLTSFSDLTPNEFMSLVSCHHVANADPIKVINTIELPDSLDYRKQNLVTKVKDQSVCGSCYIFSAIGEIEGQYAKKHKSLVRLSEQYALDCNEKFTCNGGASQDVMQWLSGTPGALKAEDTPPYNAKKLKCIEDPKKGIAKVSNSTSFSVKSPDELKSILVDHGPLSISLFVSDEFQSYMGGVLSPSDCPKNNTAHNHAVTLVGYGKEKENYWLIKNSWGRFWGEEGYVRMAFGKCSIGSYIASSEVL